MFLFILESIGTQEIILIGVVALIIFGPRRLPEIMKTVGKAIAEFKKAGNDFKTTWEREIEFEGEDKPGQRNINSLPTQTNMETTITKNILPFSSQSNISLPQVGELSVEESGKISHENEIDFQSKPARIEQIKKISDKSDWL